MANIFFLIVICEKLNLKVQIFLELKYLGSIVFNILQEGLWSTFMSSKGKLLQDIKFIFG